MMSPMSLIRPSHQEDSYDIWLNVGYLSCFEFDCKLKHINCIFRLTITVNRFLLFSLISGSGVYMPQLLDFMLSSTEIKDLFMFVKAELEQ